MGLFSLHRGADGTLASTGWKRRLLLDRGAQTYTASLERSDRCAIAILDTGGTVISWHDYLPDARTFDSRVVRRHVSQFYLPEDIALQLPAHHLAIASAHGADTHIGWRRRPSGEVFWAVTIIQTVIIDDGELLGYSHVTRSLRGPALSVAAPTWRMMPPQTASLAMAG